MSQYKLSKFLSYVLRHKPEAIDLTVDRNGWVDLNELINKLNKNGRKASLEEIQQVVKNDNKQRFKIDLAQNRIRANQGHSIDIELGLTETDPPDFLFHGTADRFLPSILEEGLQKRSRQHVHLSQDIETARKVGSRHGRPVILQIDSRNMTANGMVFYLSDNNVWLTDAVPSEYIKQLPAQ